MSVRYLPVLFLSVFLVTWNSQIARAEETPETVEGSTTIDTPKAKQLFDSGAAFIDARKDADWDAGRIPGAYHMELDKVLSKDSLAKVAKPTDPLVFYCNGVKCMVSPHAIKQAVGWGYTNIHYYRAGFPAWKAAGYPTE